MAPPTQTSSSPAPRNRPSVIHHLGAISGIWLIISAFAWPHSPSSRANTAIVGALVTLAAALGIRSATIWRLNIGLSSWLVFSTLVLYPSRPPTLWNNMATALVIVVLCLLPARDR